MPPLTSTAVNSAPTAIAIGTNFMLQGELVVVVRYENNSLIVRYDQTGLEESIEVGLGMKLIRRYILGI